MALIFGVEQICLLKIRASWWESLLASIRKNPPIAMSSTFEDSLFQSSNFKTFEIWILCFDERVCVPCSNWGIPWEMVHAYAVWSSFQYKVTAFSAEWWWDVWDLSCGESNFSNFAISANCCYFWNFNEVWEARCWRWSAAEHPEFLTWFFWVFRKCLPKTKIQSYKKQFLWWDEFQ